MEDIWQKILDHLEKKLNPQHFKTWIEPLCFKGIDNGRVCLEVPNRFIHDWVRDNYTEIICETLSDIGTDYQVTFKINKDLKRPASKITFPITHEKQEKPEKSAEKKDKKNLNNTEHPFNCANHFNINEKYTFNEFVAGSSNQFAFAAAMAVANKPATTYNPLFIYGGVGLGKTHLINAIGNHIIAADPKVRVCYYTSEKFMNELINCLRYAKMDEFRNKFRSMDILLIDDVQFIAGKERTQEEFFHTFNALYESNKQIVVTSDKFPKDIPGLEERLRSRFEWGLIADIQAPDVETKQAILKMKAEQNSIKLPEDVCYFIANSASSNVRELEGYLIRIGAYASLTSATININMAKDVLKDILVEKNRETSIEDIQKTVASHFNIKISDLKSPKRLKALVLPRQIAMYISRQITSSSYPEIGEKFGGKDHSTIIHAIKRIESRLADDFQLEKTINTLKASLER
ncbi:MAG: chromosomal replication initiator protein DnaA [Desulfuromonadaceae bacterium]|nr:chromosomal replication initiator protein DnaA [Desulfuromonadaceae bacterium]